MRGGLLRNQVDRLWRSGRQIGEVEPFKHPEDLKDGEAARGWRRHAAHRVLTVGTTNQLARDRAVAGEIVTGEHTGILRRTLHRTDDIAGNLTLVKRVAAACGNESKRFCQGLVFQHPSDRSRFRRFVIEVSARDFERLEMPIPRQQCIEAW